jgi:hypothetical protein
MYRLGATAGCFHYYRRHRRVDASRRWAGVESFSWWIIDVVILGSCNGQVSKFLLWTDSSRV